jgi:uncharacterized protein YcgL (UPF0745 family)
VLCLAWPLHSNYSQPYGYTANETDSSLVPSSCLKTEGQPYLLLSVQRKEEYKMLVMAAGKEKVCPISSAGLQLTFPHVVKCTSHGFVSFSD